MITDQGLSVDIQVDGGSIRQMSKKYWMQERILL